MGLDCPDCKSPLQTTFYEGVKVSFCTGCRGFLLGKADLQQIARIRDAVIPRDSPPPPRRAVESTHRCPKCGKAMKKGKVGKLRQTTFDLCEDCVVLWLDRGELDAIQLDHEMASDNLARARKQPAVTNPVAAATSPAPGAGGGFQCPKCGHAQTRGTECTRCGIIFAKYEAMLEERASLEAGSAALTARMDEVLGRITGFEVQQQHHLTEAMLGFERANRYTLQPVPASATGGNWQVEEGNRSGFSILGRNLFGTLYTFTMNVLDENRARVLMLERRARLYFYHLDVYDEAGRRIGSARRRFSLFNRVITVHDDREREVLRIVGPYFRPWTFLLRRSGVDAGTITKHWTGTLKEIWTDADRFSMRFAASLDARTRRLLVGAMMLIDSLYFEGRKPFLRHFFDAPGVQIMLVVVILGFLVGTPDLGRVMGMSTPAPAADRSGGAIQRRQFQDLLDRKQGLGDLAQADHYTVVEVYLDNCPICRQLERGFGPFTARRRDVTVQRVHFPDTGIQFEPTGTTQQEVTAQARSFQAQVESYQVCGTPHVEIYGPDREVIARDVCGDKSGTKFLRRWIASETSLSLRDLQTGAGAGATTPVPGAN